MQPYFTIDRDQPISMDTISHYIRRHQETLERLNRLDRYYTGHHTIMQRAKAAGLANNRLVCNHAKLITDEAVGYFIGNPVTYKADADIDRLQDWLRRADADTEDMDIAKDCSIFGRAFELLYMSNDQSPVPRMTACDPRNAFVVYDNTVDHLPVFGVYYYPVRDKAGVLTGYEMFCSTEQQIITGRLTTGFTASGEIAAGQNPFGGVTIIEFYNNEEQQGDFEQVTSLIDAYNTLQSDRVNDKEQFVQAVLVITGATLGDDDDDKKETIKGIKQTGTMELPEEARAEYLSHVMDEAGADTLRNSLAQDIHRFSGVPCMSDENFAGNASGVAMRYKLLGFEQMTKIKERFFRDGLRRRLRLICNIASIKGMGVIDPDDIDIIFTRSLPSNEIELAQMVQTLNGIVPQEILLGQLPFVDDPAAAAEEIEKQKQEAAKQQQLAFMATANTPLEDDDDEDAEP